jgi:hypothetical protein
MTIFDWLTLIVKAFVAPCDGSIVQVEKYNNMFGVEAWKILHKRLLL